MGVVEKSGEEVEKILKKCVDIVLVVVYNGRC